MMNRLTLLGLEKSDLDSEFLEVQVAEKVMDYDIGEKLIESQLVDSLEVSKNTEGEKTSVGEKGSEVNENNETDKLSEICLGEGLQMKDNEESDKTDVIVKDSLMGMENSMDEESEIKQDKDNSGKGHFVDDSFCPKKMQINIEKHKIKIDCEAIHRLLGVPCGDVKIESMTKLKIRDESVKAWKNRYLENFVAPTELVSNIENAEDEDCFNFKMDFLMCFLAVMVECHGQGDLLYVDSIECKGIKMDKNTNPISFWTMNRLKERQKWEVKNGGFGKGKYKRLSKVIEDEVEGNIGYSVEDEIEVLEKNIGNFEIQTEAMFRKTKDQIQSVLEDLTNNSVTYDENRDLQNESENDNFRGDVKNDKEDPEEPYATEPQSENDNCAGDDQDHQEETRDSEDNAGMKNDDEKGLGELNESDVDTISLGNCEIGETTNSQDTEKMKEGNLEKMCDSKESCVTEKKKPNLRVGLAIASKSPYKIRGVDITQAITKDEEFVWEYLFKEDVMMYKLYGKKKRKLDEEDKKKGKGKVGTDDESEPVFRNNFNLEVEKFRFKTLKQDTKVFNKVIDAWVDVLNYEEKYRSPRSPYRLFCDTDLIFDWMLKDKQTDWSKRMKRFILNMNRAVYWNPALMDLRGIDMVFIPMLEHDHYYLIVFELKHPTISVIDNFSDAYLLVRLNNHEDYFEKESAYKVKEIFVKYLEHVKHSKTDELNAVKIKKVKIPWATTTNALDCAVFVMRHMERYMGAKEEFNTGLSTNGPKKKKQLKILRKKYATHILLFECNKLREKIQIEALGK
ncbi:hypothetical protein L1987_13922 [Smallanthus sonchifolius]|uniref:Uncharacterized protein n=1 Tax=Smallanthus sonchifolius TaxID=185202 RepID=A0ACB9JK35_9ASTR|nr:hypothetical protein L1987_13922 [Smallanthus sonchifolius]